MLTPIPIRESDHPTVLAAKETPVAPNRQRIAHGFMARSGWVTRTPKSPFFYTPLAS